MNRGINTHVIYAAILVASLSLTGCAIQQTKIDETLSDKDVQNSIQLACGVYGGIKAGYDDYANSHKISDKIKSAVAGADVAITIICANPPTSTAELVAKVTQAGVAVLGALQEAKKDNA